VRHPLTHAATRLATLGALALCVAACTSGSSALVESTRFFRGPAPVQPQFDPRFQYLRTTVADRTVWLVLGYRDPDPLGEIEVWYSAAGETIKLQRGRVSATAGLQSDWRAVRAPAAPGWPAAMEAAARGTTLEYVRQRDTMPGYRHGVVDRVHVRAVPEPLPLPTARGFAADSLQWFEERAQATDGSSALPPALFAIQRSTAQPVFSRQCLAPGQCLTFETWPTTATD
jgi:hypothetical protein